MSMYCTVETEFKNGDALIAAISETSKWPIEAIEFHSAAVNLIGYQGDVRPQTANIIIRRKVVGPGSNDLGFELSDGVYKAIISQYDMNRGFNKAWLTRVKQNYAYHCVKIEQEKRGRKVSRVLLPDGKQRVEVRIGR